MPNYHRQHDPAHNPQFNRDWGDGRASPRIAKAHRDAALALPTHKAHRAKAATSTEAARRFVGWIQAAEAESQPQARLDAFNAALASLRDLGVTPGDLLELAQ